MHEISREDIRVAFSIQSLQVTPAATSLVSIKMGDFSHPWETGTPNALL